MKVVAVVQARMGSSRLPGKSLAPIGDRPLLAWTVDGVRAIPGLAELVVATTTEPEDEAVADLGRALGVHVHRGPVHDVLTRCWDAVAPLEPDVVVRQTGDNPFPDPDVARGQIDTLIGGAFDYVGIAGWPLGIAAEVCRTEALRSAVREATDAAEREHVMPFIYRRPERFAIGQAAPATGETGPWRFTVDTDADLRLARRLADGLGHPPPVRLAELEALMRADPTLAALNAGVEQRPASAVDERAVRD